MPKFDTPLEYCELHSGSTLFLKGNLGNKLGQSFKPGIVLDRAGEDGSVRVQYQGKVIVLERTSVFSWIPKDPSVVGIEPRAAVVTDALTEAKQAVHYATTQNDNLIQQARAQAMGQRSAQVWDPSKAQSGLTTLMGAPKYIPHAPKPVHEPFDPSTVKHVPQAAAEAPKSPRRGRPPKAPVEGAAT